MSKNNNQKSKLKIGIIPARYQSSRFEGKPLVDIAGKSMIQRVYEQAKQSELDEVLVATDDERIQKAVKAFGGKVLMTSKAHPNGTARCIAAFKELSTAYDLLVNIQGDEPFIRPQQINALLAAFVDESTEIATLYKKIDTSDELLSPHIVKVVVNQRQEALYFSRNAIPYNRNKKLAHWLESHDYYKHIGLYAFSRSFILEKIEQIPSCALEQTEQLEQLRWLAHGVPIKMVKTQHQTPSIDTPQDLANALTWFKQQQNESK